NSLLTGMFRGFACSLDRPRPFFFSSRRRHTRFSRDWSSDVCSSDLTRSVGHSSRLQTRDGRLTKSLEQTAKPGCKTLRTWPTLRSEERRVGKARRSRWQPANEKKMEKGAEWRERRWRK